MTRQRTTRARPAAIGPRRAQILTILDPDRVLLRVEERRPSEILEAELAAPQYVPVVGDRVVVTRGDDGIFVVGALGPARRRAAPLADGRLRVEPGADGGVRLEVDGALDLRAGERVSFEAEHVRTLGGRVETSARVIVESSDSAYRRAEELLSVSAGRARTAIEGAHELSAERTVIVSTGDTTIDGERVLLG